jgi:hypothetical protein
MQGPSLRKIWIAAVLCGILVAAAAALAAGRSPQPSIRGYRDWTRVNPRPAVFTDGALDCAAPARPGPVAHGPHGDAYITVYVNRPGRHAMLSEAKPRFPAGSVIVKEKRLQPDSRKPEMLTVMEKQAGSSAGNAAWEYFVYNADQKPIDHGKTEHCRSCHEKARGTDYVFRDYLPASVRASLR